MSRVVVGAGLTAALGLASATGAFGEAQTVVLTGVSLAPPTAGMSELALSFDRPPGPYSIITNDDRRVVLALAGVVRGAGATLAPPPQGLVRAVDFAQTGPILTMTLTGDGPIHLEASTTPSAALRLTVTPGAKPAVGAAAGSAAGRGVPRHVDPPADETFAIVGLKYADVSEVIGLLTSEKSVAPNDNFTPQEPAFGSVGANGGGAAVLQSLAQGGGPARADQSVGQTVDEVIGFDRRLNAIILHGPAATVAEIEARIAQIDRPLDSVVFETVFVELTDTAARNVGFEFNNAANEIGTAVYSSGSASGSSGASGKVAVALQAAINAQVQKGRGRIVSKPRISAQSGSTAKIVTGDALPILTAITLSGINGVSQQVQYVNVGVTLQIAPRITADGYVTSHIFGVVSSVTGTSQGYPKISQREASTSATVRDGESFVIGGLSQEAQQDARDRVPLLADIPFLGALGRQRTSAQEKTDLYIIVTPHIVRAGAAPSLDAGAAAALKARP